MNRFEENWCLSPEQSLLLHAGNYTVPNQLLVRAPEASNNNLTLPHNTSIFDTNLSVPEKENKTIADSIAKTMKSAGYDVRESDPFKEKLTITLNSRETSPYANRIKLMWHEMREKVIANFPRPKELPIDIEAYLKEVEENYADDVCSGKSKCRW